MAMTYSLTLDLAMDVDALLNGSFAPLTTFLNHRELDHVLRTARLPNGDVWTIPILLPAPTDSAVREGQRILLSYDNRLIAELLVQEIFSYNPKRLARLLFQTMDTRHPGVEQTLCGPQSYLTGRLRRRRKLRNILGIETYEPREVRRIIRQKKWKTAVAFHTRNAPHRGHEFLHKTALQFFDGLLIHPVIGRKKKGDFTADAIMEGYQTYIKHYLPADRVILTPLLTYSRYAGPKEAVFTALVRRNFGCTHFIVGRDHTGVGSFYDTYASHRIFDTIENLGIEPLRLHGPYYCQRCHEITTEKTCYHAKRYRQEINGSDLRKKLQHQRRIDSRFMRPEVVRALRRLDELFV